MPPLPHFRVDQCPPFFVTGVDHAGPLYIKTIDGSKVKAYSLLFTCAVTRALRLELVADLSSYEFVLALRRFISRNPSVSRLVSDNARTFLRAEKELDAIFEHRKHPATQDLLSRKKLVWTHSTEKAPWTGAFWERLVQVVKRPLRKILGSRCLPFRELETVLMEIEKMVNDRPISAVVVDPSEPRALSPSDLLYGYASQPALPDMKRVADTVRSANAIVFSERWKNQQAALRGFWKQFHNDYLQYLRSAHYRKNEDSRPIQPGDVCLLHSADASRAFWPLCVVQEVFGGQGTDGRRRSCLVKTASGQVFRRPIQLLYPLEVRQF
ncbi:uncharacterized protein LOC114828023 [Galendromus occidentalis]|uniref:Uncharacterized protein LOC114828023 n=1 Tax=Galendromus occidentalis TaxID=34638 RepID=A0AAJ7SD44_9ACAR|nr:uncharacterized protein LOC114828023 [Galendromus occidentalis]